MKIATNYDVLKPFTDCWTRADSMLDTFGDAIKIEEAGLAGLTDKAIPTHHFKVGLTFSQTKVATEECAQGLRHNSLHEYDDDSDRIIAAYYWEGWDNPETLAKGMHFFDTIISDGGEGSEYAYLQLASFIGADHLPLIGKYFDPARTSRKWCSEICLLVQKICGCTWVDSIYLDPLSSLQRFQWARHNIDEPGQRVVALLGYYP